MWRIWKIHACQDTDVGGLGHSFPPLFQQLSMKLALQVWDKSTEEQADTTDWAHEIWPFLKRSFSLSGGFHYYIYLDVPCFPCSIYVEDHSAGVLSSKMLFIVCQALLVPAYFLMEKQYEFLYCALWNYYQWIFSYACTMCHKEWVYLLPLAQK